MVMQLFHTDSRLGYTFKDIETSLALEDLLEDDKRWLHIHYLKHATNLQYDGMVIDRFNILNVVDHYTALCYNVTFRPNN